MILIKNCFVTNTILNLFVIMKNTKIELNVY